MIFPKLNSVFVAATATIILAGPTWGSVPKISGNYALNFTEVCQGVQSTNTSGFMNNYLVVGAFNSTSKTVQLTGTLTDGGLVVWDGGVAGLNQSAVSANFSYSNTATTFTVSGVIYNVAYGKSIKGVAQSAVWSGIGPDGPGCLETGTAVHQ
jgi:hypothetical protein